MIEYTKLLELDSKLREMDPVFASDANVHDIAARVGTWAQGFIAADNDHLVGINGSGIDFATVKEEILSMCNSVPDYKRLYRENVIKVLNTIEAHGAGNSPETNLPLQAMLIRAWSLRDTYTNGAVLILQNLDANIAHHGGCVPGISVRLTQPYAALVSARLEQEFTVMQEAQLSAMFQERTSFYAESAAEKQLVTLEEEEQQLSRVLEESLILSNAQAPVTPGFSAYGQDPDEAEAWRLHCELNDTSPSPSPGIGL